MFKRLPGNIFRFLRHNPESVKEEPDGYFPRRIYCERLEYPQDLTLVSYLPDCATTEGHIVRTCAHV